MRGAGIWTGGRLSGDLAGNLDDVARDPVIGQIMLCSQMALAPFSRRSVRADQKEGDCCRDNDDEGDDKGNAPCLVWGEA